MSQLHPTFERAPIYQRWTGKLAGLMPALSGPAFNAGQRWVYRVLPNGAQVAVRFRADGRKEVRIARADRPIGPEAGARWERELQTFERHLGLERWRHAPDRDASGIAEIYTSP